MLSVMSVAGAAQKCGGLPAKTESRQLFVEMLPRPWQVAVPATGEGDPELLLAGPTRRC